ncbi:ornithine cyclodeaminase/mu-crystallin family protein [Melghiribacillus thermohalophilus]|uniref:Ornithine cyclodeaminase/mu-crystallin family protein n=2 Tax=Melghiribacillus thermohalophilus TaxID=1324956 RepID=A0A4R3MSD2_9BACI|nr:ornithine cyclodeaminase/mu-crystallin family protein [Melghiribacillus thermohalophilus]
MDASWLKVMRTVAISGVAAKHLAREDARTCLVIGCGEQAKGQISAMLEVRNLERIFLYNRTRTRAESLKTYIYEVLHFEGDVEIADGPDEKVRDADIIICSTSSRTQVFDGTLAKPGTHISGIGSFKPDMQKVDLNALKRTDKIVCDTFEGCMEEAGDFLTPIEQGEISKDNIDGKLTDLVLGELSGRENESDITFFKSVGFAMADLVTAVAVYRSLKDKG